MLLYSSTKYSTFCGFCNPFCVEFSLKIGAGTQITLYAGLAANTKGEKFFAKLPFKKAEKSKRKQK